MIICVCIFIILISITIVLMYMTSTYIKITKENQLEITKMKMSQRDLNDKVDILIQLNSHDNVENIEVASETSDTSKNKRVDECENRDKKIEDLVLGYMKVYEYELKILFNWDHEYQVWYDSQDKKFKFYDFVYGESPMCRDSYTREQLKSDLDVAKYIRFDLNKERIVIKYNSYKKRPKEE